MEISSKVFTKLIITLMPSEQAECYKKTRTLLIRANEKVQNAPRNPKAFTALMKKLKAPGIRIVLAWVAKNIISDEEDYTQVFNELMETDKLSRQDITKEKTIRIIKMRRALLVGIANNKVPTEIIEKLNNLFLQSNLTSESNNENLSTEEISEEVLINPIKLLCEIALNEGVTNSQKEDGSLFKFVQGLNFIRNDDLSSLDNIISALDENDIHYSYLYECRAKVANKLAINALPKKGLLIEKEKEYRHEDINIEEVVWLCRCNNIFGSNAYFNPLGYLKDNALIIVPATDLKELLPTEGRVIAHSDKIGKLPQENEVSFWNIEHYLTDKSIKVKAKSKITKRDIYEVIEIPYKSSDAENVRYWIQNECPNLVNKTIFLLEDDILIKPRVIPLDPKNIDFNESLSLWHFLPAYKIAGKTYILGPLPKHDDLYSCEELDSSLRKIIKQSIEQNNFPNLSKAQIKEFTNTLNEASNFNKLQIERIKEYLTNTSANVNNIDNIVADLLKLKVVQDGIAAEKEKIIDDFNKGHAEHNKELNALIEEKKVQEKLIESTKQELTKLSNSLSSTIQSAFIKAKDNGIAILAENALFQALLPHNVSNNKVNITDQIHIINVPKIELSSQNLLRSLGLDKKDSRILYTLIKNAIKEGFIISLKGFSSDYFAQSLASELAHDNICAIEIPFGVSESSFIQESIYTALANNDCFIIKSINRCPANMVAKKLETMIISNWVSGESKSLNCIVTLADDDSCFTMPDKYKFLGPIIDIDASISENSTHNILDYFIDLKSNPSINNRIPKIWLDKIISLIKVTIENDPDDLSIVSKYMQNFFIPGFILDELNLLKVSN